jgi:hypothetical protein
VSSLALKISPALILLLLPFLADGADESASPEAWQREGLSGQIAKFRRVTFTPHPNDPALLAANAEETPSWWGEARVFHHVGDRIDWAARFPAEYLEKRGHYLLSCEWRYLEGLQLWALEIFDSTHLGNGSLWLFALEGRDLRLLLRTVARGEFLRRPAGLIVPEFGTARLVEDHLRAEYRALPGGPGETIVLTGRIAAMDAEGKTLSEEACEESYTWDASQRIFQRNNP